VIFQARVGICAGLILVTGLFGPLGHGASVASAASGQPVLEVAPASVTLGDRIVARVANWPAGTVTFSICGNSAQRGSEDCDQISSTSEAVREAGTASSALVATAPPVGCPCVVRATTLGDHVVRTAPIDIAGVPDGANIAAAPGPPSPNVLDVTARIETAPQGWPATWYPAFAGPAHRVLVLTMYNRSKRSLVGLQVVGSVHRAKSVAGTPVSRMLSPIPASATRVERIPFTLSAPLWGDYVASGSISGLAAPVDFSVKTANEPWALELALPIALFLWAQLLRRRERARRRAEAADAETEAVPLWQGEALFPESSPDVGVSDVPHFSSPPYDHPYMQPGDFGAPVMTSAEPVESTLTLHELVRGSS